MLLSGSAMHLTKWCTIREDNASSGSIINNIKDFVPDTIQIYQLVDGVVFDAKPEVIDKLFPDDKTWKQRYAVDAKLNTIFYQTDTALLDKFCRLLKYNGLNSMLSSIKKEDKTKKFSDTTLVRLFIVYLVLYEEFCNYKKKVLKAVFDALKEMPNAMQVLKDFVAYFKHGLESNDTAERLISIILKMDVFNFKDADAWVNLSNALVYMGARIDVDACIAAEWDASAKNVVVGEYIIKMIDRCIFSSVYGSAGTFCYVVGCYLANNNYTAEYRNMTIPAYKITLEDMASMLSRLKMQGTIYCKGIEDSEVAVLMEDITSFTALEMLKDLNAGDGSDCVVFQQILQYDEVKK